MQLNQIKKLYYSISEVSQITELKQYVLRYWETEFHQLKPNKNNAGNRNYRPQDIDLILKIKKLLYERKFTIKGAKQHLKKIETSASNDLLDSKIVKISKASDLQTLKDLKTGLDDLIKLLIKFKD